MTGKQARSFLAEGRAINQAGLTRFLVFSSKGRENTAHGRFLAVARRSFASTGRNFHFSKGPTYATQPRWKLDETKYAARAAALISFFFNRENAGLRVSSPFSIEHTNFRVNVRRLCLCTSSGLTQLRSTKPFLAGEIINIELERRTTSCVFVFYGLVGGSTAKYDGCRGNCSLKSRVNLTGVMCTIFCSGLELIGSMFRG